MSDRDPATVQWRKAMEQSTGARLREALDANQELAVEHAKACAEVERLRGELRQANEAGARMVAENRQLRAQLAARPGGQYHLTDKGMAATEEHDG